MTVPDPTPSRPRVYTLCGSTRFPDAFALANMHLTLRGHIVIGLGMSGHADEPRGARFLTSDGDEATPEKRGLDELHFRKIDLSDAIYVINVGGYIGSSTRREIAYARETGKDRHGEMCHDWTVYTVTASDGVVRRAERYRAIRWASRTELAEIAALSAAHEAHNADPGQRLARHGLEPVWVRILGELGWLDTEVSP